MRNSGVTVLMPVYNGEKYIAEAIESILTQTYQNFEFLIIDDGSNDNSIDIIKSFSDKRIKLVANESNMGIASTLNKGIAISTFDLIARMDADDISLPPRLEKQVLFMQKNPDCALLSAWAIEIDEEDKFINLEKSHDKHLYYNLIFQNCIYHPTVVFRKQNVALLGGYSIQPAEDYDLWCRISRNFKINCIEEPLLKYRIKSSSSEVIDYFKKHDEIKDQIIIKNIKYYLGDKQTVKDTEIENLCINFNSLILDNNIIKLYDSFKLLVIIDKLILEKENVNKNESNIKSASNYKKQYLYKLCAHQMKFSSAVQLSMLLKSFSLFHVIFVSRVRRKFKNIL